MCSLLTPNAWPDALNPLFLKKAGVFEVDPFLDLKKFISRLVHNFFAQFLLFLSTGVVGTHKNLDVRSQLNSSSSSFLTLYRGIIPPT